MSTTDPDDELDEYVRDRLAEADREVLRAIVESDSPLADRARRVLDYLDKRGEQQ